MSKEKKQIFFSSTNIIGITHHLNSNSLKNIESKQMENRAFNNEIGKLFKSNTNQIICSV